MENKIQVAKREMVITQIMRLSDKSTCHHKGCKKQDKYSIFIGEYPRLSNITFGSCSDHLSKFIDKAVKISQKSIRDTIANQKRAEKREAKKLLGIAANRPLCAMFLKTSAKNK